MTLQNTASISHSLGSLFLHYREPWDGDRPHYSHNSLLR